MSNRQDLDRTVVVGCGPSDFSVIAKLAFIWGLVLCAFALWIRPASAEPSGDRAIECLALTIYFEARGEPDEGKLAVGHVVMNRASHPLFPEEVCEVVQQGGEKVRYRCQFTWWCDGRSDTPTNTRAWNRIKALASRVYQRSLPDPTEGALWYHTVDVSPVWRHRLVKGPRIGQHIFYLGTDASTPRKETQVAAKTTPAVVQDPVLLVPAGTTARTPAGSREARFGADPSSRTGKISWQGPISACRWC